MRAASRKARRQTEHHPELHKGDFAEGQEEEHTHPG